MSDKNSSPVCGRLSAFAIGALVGAGIALLYAPRSGEKTRQLLARRAGELKEKAEVLVDDAKEIVREKIEAVLGAGEESVDNKGAKKGKSA